LPLPWTHSKVEKRMESLCRVFFSKTHGKGHTADYCTIKGVCHAPFIVTHGEPLVVHQTWRTTNNFEIS
jgi:hypothetical protein